MNESFSTIIPEIKHNLAVVENKIQAAAQAADRDPDSIELIVVTKNQPIEKILALLELGIAKLGENYTEEALQKMLVPDVAKFPNVEWHMIGHVQSRKARIVSNHFACVHSLDSLKLAKRLDRFSGELGRKLPVYIECNVSGEESKYGFIVWDQSMLEAFLVDVDSILKCQNLKVMGLMTMPPFTEKAEDSRSYFVALRKLSELLAQKFPGARWDGLSMGMSHDFHVAIQEGATVVRIGQAILGERR